MWDLIWFLLGALTYKLLSFLLGISQKVKFIEDIRMSAFVLIGRAFEELLKIHILKYGLLKNDPNVSQDQIKLLKNEDEIFLSKWKKKAVYDLNTSVPPLYRGGIDLKDWDELMGILEKTHKSIITNVEGSNDK